MQGCGLTRICKLDPSICNEVVLYAYASSIPPLQCNEVVLQAYTSLNPPGAMKWSYTHMQRPGKSTCQPCASRENTEGGKDARADMYVEKAMRLQWAGIIAHRLGFQTNRNSRIEGIIPERKFMWPRSCRWMIVSEVSVQSPELESLELWRISALTLAREREICDIVSTRDNHAFYEA